MNTYDYIDPNYLHDQEEEDNQGAAGERREEANTLSRVSQWLFIGALFVLPFIFIPVVGWVPSLSKVIIVSLLGLSAGAMALGAAINGSITVPKIFTVSFLGILALLILSTVSSSPTSTMLFGANLEVGSFFTTAIAVVLALLAPIVLTTRKQLFISLVAVLLSGGVLAIFHLLRLFFGAEVFAFGTFVDPSSSLVGSWFDLGIFFSVTYFISLAALTFGSFPGAMRTLLAVVLGVSLLFVGFSGLSDLILLLGIFTLAFFGVSFISPRSRSVLPGAISLVALLLLMVLSGPIADQIQNLAGFRYAEVKPTWSNTQNMLSSGLGNAKTALIGSGPNTFTNLWQQDRMQEIINDQMWWPIDFPFASGLMPTFAITFGLITTGLMTAFVVYLGIKLFVVMRDDSTDPLLATIGIASGSAALFLWLLSFIHVFSAVPFILMFMLSGIAISAFVRAGQVSTLSIGGGGRNINVAAIVGSVVCVVLIVPMVLLATSRVMYSNALVTAASAEDIETVALAQHRMRQASTLERNDSFARIESELALIRLQEILSREGFDETDEVFARDIARELTEAALRAATYDRKNYRNFVNLGLIYETLGLLEAGEAYDWAADSYATAQVLNPTNPALPLMRARLEILREDKDRALELAREALEIKPNYTDAHLFLVDVALAEEDISGATAMLEEAIKTEKELDLVNGSVNPLLYFQHGLILYAQQDYPEAIESFTNAVAQAVLSGSDYANARYFRALSNIYGDISRDEALRDLNRIAEINPENEILASVIANVEAGLDPLDGIEIEEDALIDDSELPPTTNIDAARELEAGSNPEVLNQEIPPAGTETEIETEE